MVRDNVVKIVGQPKQLEKILANPIIQYVLRFAKWLQDVGRSIGMMVRQPFEEFVMGREYLRNMAEHQPSLVALFIVLIISLVFFVLAILVNYMVVACVGESSLRVAGREQRERDRIRKLNASKKSKKSD